MLSTLKLNLGLFPSKYRSIVELFVWLSCTSYVRARLGNEGTIQGIQGKSVSKNDLRFPVFVVVVVVVVCVCVCVCVCACVCACVVTS